MGYYGCGEIIERYHGTFKPYYLHVEVITRIADVQYGRGFVCDFRITSFSTPFCSLFITVLLPGYPEIRIQSDRCYGVPLGQNLHRIRSRTTIIAMVSLILISINKPAENSWYLMAFHPLAPVYAASLLYTLNSRQRVTQNSQLSAPLPT
ncbi:hypothetical protein M422DRAFT_271413 [Sphaerobolus stellatus SS14]|uniref:Uncharacterized protein n=1 Tax=Sphaerobolus stellatus (strain SS14) TaxID=990650 RepID=A0A0C9UPP8_SPHS4|nr:hypothetical protein M422DRAFT_271413 [Sphaerobolus stellatus SS14]